MRAVLLTSLLLTVAATAGVATPKAVTNPKIVFVGDQVTANWPLSQTNPNWINLGQPGALAINVDASFQTAINLHPSIIHILVGLEDQESDIGPLMPTLVTTGLLGALQEMVLEAKNANIQVILGLEPTTYSGIVPTNAVIAAYAHQQGIPIISYQNVPMQEGDSLNVGNVPTAAGYQQMTALLENVLPTLNLQLGGGYLQNIVSEGYASNGNSQVLSNQNTVKPGADINFTAVGWYNNGSIQTQINTNLLGATGAWTSSNPLVMVIDQTGHAQALTLGTAIIQYTSLNGVAFSEWIMYVRCGGAVC
jgi:hypothetical protein